VSRYVSECPQVLIAFCLTPTEVEQIKRDLAVSKLVSSIFKEAISGLPKVHSLSTLFRRSLSTRWLNFWMSKDHLTHLKEHHLTSDMLNDVIGTVKSWNKSTFGGMRLLEVLWHVIEEINNQIIAVSKVH